MRTGLVCLLVLLAPAAAADEAGRALAEQVLTFVGGKTKIDSIQTLRRTGSQTAITPRGVMESDVKSLTRFPDSLRIDATTPDGLMVRLLTPEVAVIRSPRGAEELTPPQRARALADLRTELIAVLKNLDDAKYTFTSGAAEGDAQSLEIDADGARVTWLVDATGKVLRITRADGAFLGDLQWRTFDGGLTLPAVAVTYRDGRKTGEIHLDAIEVNPSVEPGAWEK